MQPNNVVCQNGASPILAVQLLVGTDGFGVDAQESADAGTQEPGDPRLGGDDPFQLRPLQGKQTVGVGDQSAQVTKEMSTDLASHSAASGLWHATKRSFSPIFTSSP
jgi:hypothetical protein